MELTGFRWQRCHISLMAVVQFWLALLDRSAEGGGLLTTFNRIRPNTAVFCATPNAGTTQTGDKTLQVPTVNTLA